MARRRRPDRPAKERAELCCAACLRLDRDDLAAFDEATGTWVVHQGTDEVLVGRSSRDLRGTARFEVSASRPAASSQASVDNSTVGE